MKNNKRLKEICVFIAGGFGFTALIIASMIIKYVAVIMSLLFFVFFFGSISLYVYREFSRCKK